MKTRRAIPLEHLRAAAFLRTDLPSSADAACCVLRVCILSKAKRKEHCHNGRDKMACVLM